MAKSSSSRRPSTSWQSDAGGERAPNVTLRAPEEWYFPCPACKHLRAVGLTKRRKPYLTCNDCGVQVFFRGKEGIRRLREMQGRTELSGNVGGLAGLLEYVAFLRGRLRGIQQEKPVFGENPDLELEEKVIETEIGRLRKVLESELREKRRQLRQLR